MITTVTLNAAIDKTYMVSPFQLGEVHRVQSMHVTPGGKGNNSAQVIHQLGEKVVATGFIAGTTGKLIQLKLEERGVAYDFVEVEGESRVCLNIMDELQSSLTELLEPGPVINKTHLAAMEARIGKLAAKSEIVCFSGSLPTGAPKNTYAHMIDIASQAGAKVFLDTSGEGLTKGIAAKPFLIKPNEDEVEQLIGKKMEQEKELYEPIRQLLHAGISCVVISLGARGAIAGFQDQILRIKIPKLKAVNTVGCGDAFIAGMACAVKQDRPMSECLRLAAATGSAKALTDRPGHVNVQDVKTILPQIEIEAVL